MRSLFARIWLSYWLVMALTLIAALAVSFVLAVKRAESLDRLNPAMIATSARITLANQGPDGLRAWLVDYRHMMPELQIYFVDGTGRELLNRSVAGRPLSGGDAFKLIAPNGAAYRMYVRRTRSFVFDFWNIVLQPWVLIVLAIVASGLGSAWLSLHLTRPILQLRGGVRAIAAGDLDARMGGILTRRPDELGGLARDFDAMASELRRLIASKEELLRDISHELRSPLARLRVAAGLARRGGGEREFDRIDREVERLDSMIGQILRFSRLDHVPATPRQPVDLRELIESIVEDARIEAAAAGVLVGDSVGGQLFVDGDAALLRSAIENVLRNAIRFAPEGTQVEIRLSAGARTATLEIADAGPGVGEADLPLIFEPFHRGAGSAGIGLGLTLARRICLLHCGTIEAGNRPTGGLSVRLYLPLAASGARDGEQA